MNGAASADQLRAEAGMVLAPSFRSSLAMTDNDEVPLLRVLASTDTGFSWAGTDGCSVGSSGMKRRVVAPKERLEDEDTVTETLRPAVEEEACATEFENSIIKPVSRNKLCSGFFAVISAPAKSSAAAQGQPVLRHSDEIKPIKVR